MLTFSAFLPPTSSLLCSCISSTHQLTFHFCHFSSFGWYCYSAGGVWATILFWCCCCWEVCVWWRLSILAVVGDTPAFSTILRPFRYVAAHSSARQPCIFGRLRTVCGHLPGVCCLPCSDGPCTPFATPPILPFYLTFYHLSAVCTAAAGRLSFVAITFVTSCAAHGVLTFCARTSR